MTVSRVLVVEDDLALQRVIQAQIARLGVQVSVASDVPHAVKILQSEMQDLVITDLNLPGVSGIDLLKLVRAEYPETTAILMTAFATVETAVQAMKMGAYDYLTKPLHPFELKSLVSRVLERKRLIEEVHTLRGTIDRKYGFENILGNSNALLRVLDAAAHVATTDATILILGETGTGKELLAKAIHVNSGRRTHPFVVINCGAIPRELLESELFGHVRGAFTGALTHKKGKVEMADGGTVFLDEIGEMPLDLQVRMLRLVQEREIEKVGAAEQIKVDVRIIAATHRNLEELAEQGKFREDLYYRLAVVPLTLPPLRDRKEDIPELVHQFFERLKQKHGKPDLRFPSSLLPYFQNYDWPGNVRELDNLIARMVLLSRGDAVTLTDLPAPLCPSATGVRTSSPALPDERTSLHSVERSTIVAALCKFQGNQSHAARYLSISRKILVNRMRKFNIIKAEIENQTSNTGLKLPFANVEDSDEASTSDEQVKKHAC